MRRVLIGLLVVLLALGAADTLAWTWATRRMETRYAAWTRAQRAAGWTIHAGAPRRSGWPLAATLIIAHLHLSRAVVGAPGHLSWRTARLRLSLPLGWPPRLLVQPEGAQTLRPALRPPVPYRADLLRLTLPLSLHGGPRGVRLRLRGLVAGLPPQRLRIGFATLRLDRSARGGTLRFAARAQRIVLPRDRHWPLGRRIAALAGHGTLTGAVPPAGDLWRRAAIWQASGGRLRLRQVALRWGPLTASLDATIGLAPGLDLRGHGQAMVQGYDRALDLMAANRAVTPDAAVAAKAALSVLAQAPGGHAGGPVTIPFVLHRGRLLVDGMPLLRLPPIGALAVPAIRPPG